MRKIDSFQVGLEGKGVWGEGLQMQDKKGCNQLLVDAKDDTAFAVFSFQRICVIASIKVFPVWFSVWL